MVGCFFVQGFQFLLKIHNLLDILEEERIDLSPRIDLLYGYSRSDGIRDEPEPFRVRLGEIVSQDFSVFCLEFFL